MNVKLNKRIREELSPAELFIQPAAGDAGCAIGAALFGYYSTTGKWKSRTAPIKDVRLGTSYPDEQVENTLEGSRHIQWSRVSCPEEEAATLVQKGLVVGWFQERMEFGPRALGARSVLANPRDPTVVDRINASLKRRERFQPFAPSIPLEDKDEYLVNSCEAPFMILAFDARTEKKMEVPAVVFVDGTMRPQTVDRNISPQFHKLLRHLHSQSGVSAVLNTSFNIHGEPLVESPQDAISTLTRGGVDVLLIGHYLAYPETSPIQKTV